MPKGCRWPGGVLSSEKEEGITDCKRWKGTKEIGPELRGKRI